MSHWCFINESVNQSFRNNGLDPYSNEESIDILHEAARWFGNIQLAMEDDQDGI